jgi:hypothetical protein
MNGERDSHFADQQLKAIETELDRIIVTGN